MNEIKCKITKSTSVFIRAKDANINLNEPLFAINWFSTKVAWMYHLYNFLASKSLAKIGGKGFFKGKITKTILDENDNKRDLILIVRYPNATSFKSLMENTYFKIVSLFRMAAVKDFSFGFTHKQTASQSDLSEGFEYVVHHFKTTDETIYTKLDSLLSDDIQIKYAGRMVAELFSKQAEKKIEQVPNIMDGIVLFEAKSEDSILKMIAQDEYHDIIETLDSSYIATVKRVL